MGGSPGAVLRVLYLIFNEGYLSSSGPELARGELSPRRSAWRGLLTALPRRARGDRPACPDAAHRARRPARTGAGGADPAGRAGPHAVEPEEIAEGDALIVAAWGRGPGRRVSAPGGDRRGPRPGRRAARTPTGGRSSCSTQLLERITSANPMVSLNRAIAAAMVHGAQAGLELLKELEQPLADNHRLLAARAHLREMAGEREGAIADYRAAADRTRSAPEQRYLLTRAAGLEGDVRRLLPRRSARGQATNDEPPRPSGAAA